MTFLQLDDNFAEHPKITGLSDEAFRLHVAAICYCSRHLTDGVISEATCRQLVGKRTAIRPLRELSTRLLWHPIDPGYWQIHDYLDWNPSREDVERKRAVARQNALRRWSASGP